MGLSTGFVKVAQSGQTIDGREIKPEWLLEAAESYDKAVYTAVVFPEHNPYADNYGTVEAVKAEKDKNGVVSLFADLSPNALWQSDMRFKQKMFTSIALMPNFAKTGKTYLYSMAATDVPASLGVQQLEFSKKDSKVIFTDPLKTKLKKEEEPTEDEAVSFFRKLFKSSKGDDMSQADKDTLNALQEKFTKLETNYNALAAKVGDSDKVDKAAPTAEQFSTLQAENADLKAKVATLEKQGADFAKVKTDLETLKLDFAKALKEEIPGTDAKKDSVPTQEFNLKYEV